MQLNNKGRGFGGFYTLMILMMAFFVLWFMKEANVYRNTYTFEEFRSAIQQDKVESVWIEQNKAVPTGSVEITLKENDENRYLNVSDVNEVQAMLAEEGFSEVYLQAIPEESWFLNVMVPTIVIAGVLIFSIMMMNRF